MDFETIYFFSSLDSTQQERIRKFAREKQFSKGEFLFFEGEKPQYLHILTEGVVKVYKTLPNGNEIVIHNFFPPTMVAEMPCLEHINYPATAVCETDVTVTLIDYETFEKEFLQDPKINFNIIRSLTKKIKNLDAALTNTMTLSATQRCAKFIRENPETFVSLKQKKVAEILNITPETLSRTLKKFKKAGAMTMEKGKPKIVDSDKLVPFL
jgi:CRP/FNR family transcriptional regulator